VLDLSVKKMSNACIYMDVLHIIASVLIIMA